MQIGSVRKTLASERAEAVRKATEAMAVAGAEDRELTAEERAAVDAHLAEAQRLKAKVEALQADDALRASVAAMSGEASAAVAAIGGAPMPVRNGDPAAAAAGRRIVESLGAQFIASAVYRDEIRGKARPRGWRSSTVDLDLTPRAVLDSTGAGALVIPTYVPGIYGPGTEPLVVGDLFAPGTTDSNAVIYMQETAFTSGAATVAEGALKPESSLTFEQVTDLVKKIATWLGVTDEMLDDSAQLRSYIDSRLRTFVEQAEEDQLLNGDGLGSNLLGIRNRVGLAPDIIRTGAENNADAIYRQIAAITANALLMPDAIVMNPADFVPVQLLKTTDGAYISGGPFNAPAAARMWGLPVVLTGKMTAGTGLVGAFKSGGQIFRKGGIAVETSNSHADYFTRNLTAIRAEERLALAVYRPAGFGEVTSLLGSAGVLRTPAGGGDAAPAAGKPPAKRDA